MWLISISTSSRGLILQLLLAEKERCGGSLIGVLASISTTMLQTAYFITARCPGKVLILQLLLLAEKERCDGVLIVSLASISKNL